jgi:hypothetical protein
MAKLIVTRPRLGSRWDIEQRFEMLIDGKPNAPIGLGETIVIDLPPGPHLAKARLADAGSQPVVVGTAPGQTHRLAVGTNVGLGRLMITTMILGLLPLFGLIVWFVMDTNSLLQSVKGGTVSFPANGHHDWQMALLVPAALLAVVCMLAYPAFSRNHAFVLTEVRDHDLTDEQIATLLRERPFRVRINIRQLMIAVAISALCSWISLEIFRDSRASSFRSAASMHADLEDMFRGINAAKADYHAIMRHKYAQAVASRSFSVDPDPSAPP